MTLRKGSNVWVDDKSSAWVAAQVTDFIGKQVQVVTEYGKKVLSLPEKLYPRDEEADHGGVDDMTKLTYLNEPGVLDNLQRRYGLNEIYTYTGSILIAVNPFTKLPHLYNVHMMEQYKGAPFGELSPHVFAVADASYRAMMSENQSQSILVSGESGAGKTETTKLIMQYLTYVGGRAAADDRTVEQQVLESNPLLEAFGNARTIRNDNSSRFGKFVEIQFDASGRISGAAIRTYLLERSRVVQLTDPERNYHCFYQLCASGMDAEKYKLGHPSDFHYLNQSKTYELDGVSNAEEYTKTRRAMDIVGISQEEQEAIFRTLAAILHLGNIEFSPGKEHDSSVIKDEKSRSHLQMAAKLFKCDVQLLVTTLCTRSIQTYEGIIIKALDCGAAVAGRDTLAKTVYAQLFDWLVEKINRSVGQDPDSLIQIGVLDIYGFECFKQNSFEQFCINFANEKLQQHFNEHVFKMEQEEYQKEAINWSYIEFIDNQDVLDLIEKKPIGVIALLDEACMFPKSTHETFTNKLFQNFPGHPRLEKAKFYETDFTISHYAGKVTYKTETFLDKNRDYVVVEHRNLLSSSKCPFIADLFPSLGEESSRSSYKFSSVASRFKQQLQALMETLSTTEPHYIRCVKPNSLNRPQKFENVSILHQLRCGGVLEAVRISLAGYPTRRTYHEFIDRFGLIVLDMLDGSIYMHINSLTYTGSILIAVNPFTKLPHLYNVHMMEQYKGAPFGELSPHVFAVADASYRAMMSENQSQSILVSGESGAGKTETTKLIMQYLTYVGGRAAADDRTVEQQVLESNPLLEAFGNARTIRNDNSSRFGKFVEIQFDASGRISGAAIRTYLLERSRVVQLTDPERNYHCFYQLCASGMDAEKYKLGHPSDFHYLNQSKTYELDGVSNAEEYTKTRRAMDIVGISQEEQEAIFRTLAAILHLGNIEFSPGKEHDSSVIKDEKSRSHLQMAAKLFKCDVQLLVTTLCTRSIQTYEGIIIKALDCGAAVAGRDTLAKTVYAQLFDWLVEKINRSVGQDPDSLIQIGVLDIYGFECFKQNSFEQFCINFANEKLQQHFNEHVFKMEQEEYQKEAINWSYIEFIDNQDVLDLIEKKPIGVIALLDEACMFPKSTHETFTNKLFQNFPGHPRLEKAKFYETDFTISHYAGKVTYKTETFLDKNRDYVVVEHRNLLSSSKCPFIADLFPSLGEESSRSSYKFSSVASRFKQQLQALMETLSTTEPHYIRCVKPNSLNRPQKFENVSILHQLRCGGVLEAVRISLAGYPTRRTYHEFIDRFGLIVLDMLDGSNDEKTITEKILQKLKLGNYQLGKTKVFLRAGQIGILDSRRAEILDLSAKQIQSRLRTFLARRDFISNRMAAIHLQSCCRGYIARNIYAALREASAVIVIQKYVRQWIMRNAYLQLYASALLIQSCTRGFAARQKFLHRKENKAATIIQAHWRMCKIRSAFRHRHSNIITIQCLWRRKIATREFRRLKKEANEAGALRLAKTKLERQLEDLTWRLQLEKKLRLSNEEAKLVEISKLNKTVESLILELDAAKLAAVNEVNKNAVLQRQLELYMKEKAALEREILSVTELRNENTFLKSSLSALEEKNSALEHELIKGKEESTDTIAKLRAVEETCSQLQQNLKSMEEKLSNSEDENHILRQKALSATPRSNRPGFAKSFSDKFSGALALASADRKTSFESPTPTKMIAPLAQGFSDSRRAKLTSERQQENCEILSRCIKENLGFKDGKPVAACVIYRCLIHWHAFESERTAIFDFIIAEINEVLKVGDEDVTLPYWLSNASALLCLLQRNLRANGFFSTCSQRSGGVSALNGRVAQSLKSPLKFIGLEDGMSHMEARYPALLFKQQLTACVEKIFGLIRDNLKKEISPLLGLCIQAPKIQRVHGGKSTRSPGGIPQQAPSSQWDSIIKFLDSFLSRLRGNHVPSFFIRKLTTQVFSFINISLFNSLLLRRECCTFSNGEYVKSGLAELEKWIVNAKEEFAGTSWHELNYIRQAVGFLVIHQKRKKSLEEIRQDLCPALTTRQIYRISTMYWDDKYGTQSVSNEVVAQMREILNKDSQNLTSNSFLLDDDLSIPFLTEDIYMALPELDPSLMELPKFLSEYPSALLLIQHTK